MSNLNDEPTKKIIKRSFGTLEDKINNISKEQAIKEIDNIPNNDDEDIIEKKDDVKAYLNEKLKEFVSAENMLVSCMGGHGRTGTVLSIWAGLHDIENPIQYVRKIYCEEAVETVSQEMFVNLYLKYLRSL